MRNKEGLVDDLITSIPGEWKFDEQVSQHFDTHVRKSVPLYEEVQKAVIEISEWFIRDNSVVYDLGSSTGETISLLLQKHSRKKNVRFIGVEESLYSSHYSRFGECVCNHNFYVYYLFFFKWLDGIHRSIMHTFKYRNAIF